MMMERTAFHHRVQGFQTELLALEQDLFSTHSTRRNCGKGECPMTMIQLRYFTTVCRCKSVTQAAKELHVSQPSVSNSIRALEDELGIQLFYRIKLQMFLTQEGEIFLEKAVKILRDVDQLTQQMKDLRGTRKMVRVGISPMVSAMYFPEILLPFREAYPDIRVEVEEWGALTCRQRVLDEAMDLAIIATNDMDQNKLESRPIIDAELKYYVSRDHPLADRAKVTVEEIQNYEMLLLPTGAYTRRLVEQMFRSRGLQPRVLLYTSQLYTMERILQGSTAGTFLLDGFASSTHDLVGISVSPALPTIRIGAVWKRGKQLYSDATLLIDYAKRFKQGHSLKL